MKIDPSVLHDLRDAQRGIVNLNALDPAEQIEALAMALAFVIRAVGTAYEQEQTEAAAVGEALAVRAQDEARRAEGEAAA